MSAAAAVQLCRCRHGQWAHALVEGKMICCKGLCPCKRWRPKRGWLA